MERGQRGEGRREGVTENAELGARVDKRTGASGFKMDPLAEMSPQGKSGQEGGEGLVRGFVTHEEGSSGLSLAREARKAPTLPRTGHDSLPFSPHVLADVLVV